MKAQIILMTVLLSFVHSNVSGQPCEQEALSKRSSRLNESCLADKADRHIKTLTSRSKSRYNCFGIADTDTGNMDFDFEYLEIIESRDDRVVKTYSIFELSKPVIIYSKNHSTEKTSILFSDVRYYCPFDNTTSPTISLDASLNFEFYFGCGDGWGYIYASGKCSEKN